MKPIDRNSINQEIADLGRSEGWPLQLVVFGDFQPQDESGRRTSQEPPAYTVDKESFVSIEKAESEIGYQPKYSNVDALIRNYEWYLDNLENFEAQSGVSHRVPWSQGILSLAKLFF